MNQSRGIRININNPVAKIIDAICDENELTGRQLAVMAGMKYPSVSRFRSRDQPISRDLALVMYREWPMSEAQAVALFTHLGYLLPGYTMVPR